MERKEILEKIAAVRKELAEDQFAIACDKILERKFHHHKSNRKWFLGKSIERLRRKLMMEIEFILEPVLDTQREINLRLLEEVRKLKREVEVLKKIESGKEDDFQDHEPFSSNQK